MLRGTHGGPIVPIGGAYASGQGGYIDILDALTDEEARSIDVANWRVRREFVYAPLICSGLLGAEDARRVLYRYHWQADILWDYRWPADTLKGLRSDDGLDLTFWFGDVQALTAGGFSGSATEPYIWCPDAVLSVGETMLDAINKKMSRVPCGGVGRTHFFQIPAEGIESDTATLAGAFAHWFDNQ